MKHENVVLFDKTGLPSIMVKFTPEDGKPLDPVFMVCGRRAKAIYISKYENTLVKGVPCSIPYAKAANCIDLCGDNWEMVAGLRLHKGAIEYIKDNDAAVADLSPESKAWQRAQTEAGETIYLDASSGNIVVTTKAPEEDCWDGCGFKEMKIELEEVPEILRQLGIVPQNVEEETAYIYADTGEEEAVPFRGYRFYNTSNGGVGALRLSYPRSLVYGGVGFRSAFIEFEELETEN